MHPAPISPAPPPDQPLQVASSVVCTIMILNYHHRLANTHSMPKWVSIVFLQVGLVDSE